MKNLQTQKVWCIYQSGKGFIGVDGKPATDANLTTFNEASEYMNHLHHRAGEPYPMPYSIALTSAAADVIAISLLNCWTEGKGIADGAAAWADTICSYTERCWPSADGTSIRILARGKMPDGAVIPAKVQIQAAGFVTLTCQRISPRPSWRVDPGPTIRDASEALQRLLVPKKPQYVKI